MAESEELSDYSSGDESEVSETEEPFVLPEPIASRVTEEMKELIESVAVYNPFAANIVVQYLEDPKVLEAFLANKEDVEGVLEVKAQLGLLGDEDEEETVDDEEPVVPERPATAIVPERPISTIVPERPSSVVRPSGVLRPTSATIPERPTSATIPERPSSTIVPERPTSAIVGGRSSSAIVPESPSGTKTSPGPRDDTKISLGLANQSPKSIFTKVSPEKALSGSRLIQVPIPPTTTKFQEQQVVASSNSVAMQRSGTLAGSTMSTTAAQLGSSKRPSLGQGVPEEEVMKQVSLTKTVSSILSAPPAPKPQLSQLYSSPVVTESRLQQFKPRVQRSSDINLSLQHQALTEGIRRREIRKYLDVDCSESPNPVLCLSVNIGTFNAVKYGVSYSPQSFISESMDMILLTQ